MVGLIFTISLLSILTAVGFLFAWVVRLASEPDANSAQKSNSAIFSSELSEEKIYIKKP
ncbi:hypothetical protein [Candidatus Berkiella aquae]|uniref:Uncharacterized protein n=1 Tax=Candidatus Berkiella aquae TaxID=295108 RepID=A0A0Q9YWI2_9GAMM|nr:hypothetical protein [Candidatus Berkiella aquae]MCS5712715.1 hypothetical protein [Candidatus Berkiella aquae]